MPDTRTSHHIPCPLSWGDRTQALWSFLPPRAVVVFVHGYSGHAVSTWLEFPGLLARDGRFAEHDFIFYGYKSRVLRADAIAESLFRFLDTLATQPARIVNASLPPEDSRPDDHRYSRLVVVAHSLGAVVARLALLRAHRRGSSWLNAVSFALFSPAHLGADILQLASQSLLGPLVVPVAKWFSPVLLDLEKGSLLLDRLRADTEDALDTSETTSHLVAKTVVHSPRDSIVPLVRFCGDPDAEYVEDHRTHQTVCKPTEDGPRPFDLVVNWL